MPEHEIPPPNNTRAFVTITPREIYEAVMRLDAAMRENTQRMNELLGEDGPIRDLKKRTRALELKVWGLLSGMIPVIGLLVIDLLAARGGV